MTTKTTRRVRRSEAEWAGLVEEWRGSGLSADEFADARDLGRVSLLQWATRLSRAAAGRSHRTGPAGGEEPRFIPVQLSPRTPKGTRRFHGCIEIELPTGAVVRLRGDVSSAALTAVFAAMEGAAC